MPDHPVKRKLRGEILPYLVSSQSLPRQWFYRLHAVFGYTTDILAALAGIGVTTPLLQLLAPTPASGDEGLNASLPSALTTLPHWLYVPMAACVIAWIVLRVGFNREEGQKRAVLARSCRQTMKQAEARLHRILIKPDPMPELTSLVEELLVPTVDRNVQENSWPWSGPDPDADPEVEKQLAKLCEKYEINWAPVDPLGIRS